MESSELHDFVSKWLYWNSLELFVITIMYHYEREIRSSLHLHYGCFQLLFQRRFISHSTIHFLQTSTYEQPSQPEWVNSWEYKVHHSKTHSIKDEYHSFFRKPTHSFNHTYTAELCWMVVNSCCISSTLSESSSGRERWRASHRYEWYCWYYHLSTI